MACLRELGGTGRLRHPARETPDSGGFAVAPRPQLLDRSIQLSLELNVLDTPRVDWNRIARITGGRGRRPVIP